MTEPPPRANFSATANQVCSVFLCVYTYNYCTYYKDGDI